MNSIKEKLNTVLDNLNKIVDKFEFFMELYNACKSDELLSDVSEIEFISSFSDLKSATTSISFTSFIDGKHFTSNLYLSEFDGQITFRLSNDGITAVLDLCLSEQFSDPEEAYEIYKKYDYIEYDDLYKRELHNTQAGRFEIIAKNHFNFSRMNSIKTEHIIKLSKATFLEMYNYLNSISQLTD